MHKKERIQAGRRQAKAYKRKKKENKTDKDKLTPERRERIVEQVKTLAGPLLDNENIVLVEVVFVKEFETNILRLFIDKPGGITLDDCSHASILLSDLLDVEMKIENSYRLEVSSPGI